MDTVLADLTSDGIGIRINSSPTDIAKLSFHVHGFGPTVRNWVLDYIGGDSRTRTDHCLETSVMDNEVADLTDATLANQSPQHVSAMVTVCWLMEGLL